MQLTDAPEGKSSLQIRLNEAEKRAQEAETSAHDAQAALARTLLEAARVEAVVTARVKAESEAEIESLKAELDAAKRAAAEHEALPEAVQGTAAGSEPHGLCSPGPIEPDVLATSDLSSGDADDTERELMAAVVPASRSYMLIPARLAFLAIVLIVAVASYSLTTRYLAERAGPAVAVGMSAPDPQSERVVGADARIMPRAAEANWLLYMPVERTAVAEYLGAGSRKQKQLAVKNSVTVNQ